MTYALSLLRIMRPAERGNRVLCLRGGGEVPAVESRRTLVGREVLVARSLRDQDTDSPTFDLDDKTY